jgi:hypothetical protein
MSVRGSTDRERLAGDTVLTHPAAIEAAPQRRTGARMTDLLVIDVSVKSGRGHVVLAAEGRDPSSAKLITLEFPLDRLPAGPYPEQEAKIVQDAQAILHEASTALAMR